MRAGAHRKAWICKSAGRSESTKPVSVLPCQSGVSTAGMPARSLQGCIHGVPWQGYTDTGQTTATGKTSAVLTSHLAAIRVEQRLRDDPRGTAFADDLDFVCSQWVQGG